MNTSRTIPELGIDTQTIERLLIAAEIGAIVTYTTLSAAIGRDVQRDARHITLTARRRLLRSDHMVFEPVIDVGLKRLDDIGIVGLGPSIVGRLRRMSKRGAEKLTAVRDFDALPNAAKVDHNVRLAQLGAIGHLSGARATRQLVGRVEATQRAIPLRECLSAMKAIL